MSSKRYTHPLWDAVKRPVAYVRVLEVALPQEYTEEDALDEGFLDMVTAYATYDNPGLPSLVMIGGELHLPDRPLGVGELTPFTAYFYGHQELYDDTALDTRNAMYAIHDRETIEDIPEWLGEALCTKSSEQTGQLPTPKETETLLERREKI